MRFACLTGEVEGKFILGLLVVIYSLYKGTGGTFDEMRTSHDFQALLLTVDGTDWKRRIPGICVLRWATAQFRGNGIDKNYYL